ncbi:hypothetical protein CAPTEDRAFT_185658 [Capitella teleta]|uniref:THAP-type domain-containing protein n=1 Tax=Capitella teleta TaxID=283909 RepID=R7UKD4_CAPTE|nr:hypothetical protein CAPTEDRAFT_185658 [Capitella teleta]|eukprot:ELU06999.1 hypothetical protein CAPTEDRAFT_185658 [Capitella teleta]
MPSASKWSSGYGAFCAANCCDDYQGMSTNSFFTFPLDQKRCDVWVQNTRRDDIRGMSAESIRKKNERVCAKHFEPSQFMNPKRNKLIPSAVPTLVDVPNPPPTLQSKRKAPAVRHRILIPTKMKKLSNEPCAVDDDSFGLNHYLREQSRGLTETNRRRNRKMMKLLHT